MMVPARPLDETLRPFRRDQKRYAMTPLIIANIVTTAILLGVNNNDRNFTRYDYSLPITNDVGTPLEALHLDIANAEPPSSALLENWRFDTSSGVDYWSSVVANDLQPSQSTVLQFTADWLTTFTYSAYFFNPVTYDELQETGTVTVVIRGPLEVPEPASLAFLFGSFWLLLSRKNKHPAS
jgi:hypothetical protein